MTTAETLANRPYAIADALEAASKTRRILKRRLAIFEQFEGRHWARLSEADQAQCRAALGDPDEMNPNLRIMPQEVQKPSKAGSPVFDCAGLRERIARIEADIHAMDTLDTLPEVEDYYIALNAFREASRRLHEATTAAGCENESRRLLACPTFHAAGNGSPYPMPTCDD